VMTETDLISESLPGKARRPPAVAKIT
jgi:hypothetical protein